jgi:hypothetical protein
MQKNDRKHAEINQRLKDTSAVTEALKRAAREAIEAHARAGQKIVVWRDNQIVWEDPNVDEEKLNADTDP